MTLRASREEIEQVVLNLMMNALQAQPNGGQVTVRVRPPSPDNMQCELIVEDDGPGIAEKDLPRLFERFYRADKARSRDIPGTGLGLSLVKSIVDAYGGQITVTSEGVGKGTVVARLHELHPEIFVSVSATTRAPRATPPLLRPAR